MSDESYILLLPPQVIKPTIASIAANGYVPVALAVDDVNGEIIVKLLNDLHAKKDDNLRERILAAVNDAIEDVFEN